tara:strand:- start:709 stop:1080 length:372 start_codon:yes stop_codon:yes gene_type:complete
MLDILSILLLICLILLIVFFNPITVREGLDDSCETKLAAAQAPVLKGQTPQGMINTAAIANLTKQIQGFSSLKQDVANLTVSVKKQQEALQKIGQQIQTQAYSAANVDPNNVPSPLPTVSGIN